ncbi:MAG: Crp/Fnr family transcriptional regulator [Anaerolineales bacterium]|jgi:CRP-like cAMP-binding protein
MFTVESLIDRIGAVSHFKGLPRTALKDIVVSGQVLHYSPDQVIFREQEPCSGLYVLFKGEVHLYKIGPQGQETIIGMIEPVIMFNEVSVLDGGPNPVSALAHQGVIVWRVGYERFQMLMERYPPVGLSLLRVLARRNRLLLAHCADLTFRSVLGRTAKILLDLSENGQKTIDRREYSNQVLAARVATVPEPISRSIQSLRHSGLIACSRSWIRVNQPARLAELAQIEPDQFH